MQNGHLLIVEDDSSLLDLLTRTFTAAGFCVTQATNGADGLQFATSIHPDAILTDFRMPTMDGLTMLENIQATDWGTALPVILYAGSMADGDEHRAQNVNIAAHLTKGMHTPADAVIAVWHALAAPHPQNLVLQPPCVNLASA
jgi:CheY-like chemotaxis protein